MTGIVNSTGAKSGIIGTTVGSVDLATATFPGEQNSSGGGGHVLQVIFDNDATDQTLATTTYTPTDLAIAITPSSESNKILCQWKIMALLDQHEGFGTQLYSSEDGVLFTSGTEFDVYSGAAANQRLHASWAYLDSPNSISAITYTIKAASHDGNSIILNTNANQTQLIVMEIAG